MIHCRLHVVHVFLFHLFKPKYHNLILIGMGKDPRLLVQSKRYLARIQNYNLVQKRFLHKGHVELLEVLNHLYKHAA